VGGAELAFEILEKGKTWWLGSGLFKKIIII
jgi:hypothetical protein